MRSSILNFWTGTTVSIVLLTVFVMGGTTAPFLKMCGIQMGPSVTAKYVVPELSSKLQKISIKMQKILCNYDEDG